MARSGSDSAARVAFRPTMNAAITIEDSRRFDLCTGTCAGSATAPGAERYAWTVVPPTYGSRIPAQTEHVARATDQTSAHLTIHRVGGKHLPTSRRRLLEEPPNGWIRHPEEDEKSMQSKGLSGRPLPSCRPVQHSWVP